MSKKKSTPKHDDPTELYKQLGPISYKHADNLYDFSVARLEECCQAYRYGNLGAILDGLYWCREGNLPLPEWLHQALANVVIRDLLGERPNRRGRHARWVMQYRENMVDFARYDMVRDCIENGKLTWEAAYVRTEQLLTGQFGAGSIESIQVSYKRVARNMRANPGRYYMLTSELAKSILSNRFPGVKK